MTAHNRPPFDPTRWRTASASGANGGCLAVNDSVAGVIGLRDSKQGGDGPELVFTEAQWATWLGEVAARVHTGVNGVVLVDEHADGGWTLRSHESGAELEFTPFEVACFLDGVASLEFGDAAAA